MYQKLSQIITSGASHVVIATMVGNLISYIFNVLAQRILSVEDFGHSTASINLILIVGLISLSLTYTITKYAAWHSHQDAATLPSFISASRYLTIIASISIFALLSFLFLPITSLFKLPAHPAVFAAITVSSSLLLILSWQRGVLAGTRRYTQYAASLLVENAVKLLVVFLPLPLALLDKFLISMPIGMLSSLVFLQLVCPVLRLKTQKPFTLNQNSKAYFKFFAASLYTTACIQILLFADVLFVKARFSVTDAGMYATLVLVGKIIYFCINSLIAILIPEISHLHAKKASVKSLLFKSLLAGFVMGIGLTVLFSYLPQFSIYLLLSSAKTAPVLSLIPYYGLAATAISLIIITSTTLLVVGFRFFLPLISVVFLIQAIVLGFLVNSLFQVVVALSTVSLVLLLLILSSAAIEKKLKHKKQLALSWS